MRNSQTSPREVCNYIFWVPLIEGFLHSQFTIGLARLLVTTFIQDATTVQTQTVTQEMNTNAAEAQGNDCMQANV